MTLKVTVLEQEVERLSSDGELESVSLPKECKGEGMADRGCYRGCANCKGSFSSLNFPNTNFNIVASVYNGAQCIQQMFHIS